MPGISLIIICNKKMAINEHNNIVCESLTKEYSTRRQTIKVLSGIDLTIEENEIVLLKGRSGAGKTTLLHLMGGLIKPTSGRIKFGKLCLSELSNSGLSSLLLNNIGFIFQNFNLLPTYSIYENIEIALAPKGYNDKEIEKIINPLLEEFGLINKTAMLPAELSIGQQQKVAVVRTIAKQPSVIFADEPTGSVDIETAGEIIQYLIKLRKEKGSTIIVATHGSFSEEHADKTILLENGFIIRNPYSGESMLTCGETKETLQY